MSIFELFLIAVALSMDAFAVAVCKGLSMRRLHWGRAAVIALLFGGFQALMPLLGWLLGTQFEQYITAFDHWIAFALLAFIGGKMIWESRKSEEEAAAACDDRLDLGELLVLAVATSIDALAVGITFALLPEVRIWASIGLIGVTTFVLSLLGVAMGNRFGSKYQQKAELAGGVILVAIGLKILLEHLGVISF